MSQKAISVIIPSFNCASLVPAHLESLRPWIHLASEVVVVDSHSEDGTIELLREGIKHPQVRFLDHPRGLYQSWNFGIQQARGDYIYISTVGDSITGEGIEQLLAAAVKLDADVVISKPRFIDEQGQPASEARWPIADVLERLPVTEPTLITASQRLIIALTNGCSAILGSSASDLYRASFLKARPFPIEYGTAGDAGWGIEHIFDVKIGVIRGQFSTFRFHEKAYSPDMYRVDSLPQQFFQLARKVIRQRQDDPRVKAVLDDLQWELLEPALQDASVAHNRLEEIRDGLIPWILVPEAWRSRARRNWCEEFVRSTKERVFASSRA